MISPRFPPAFLAVILLVPSSRAETIQHGLRVPAGFEVTEYAGSDRANDIYCMTLDPRGRVVVSGRGYIRLFEEGADGKAGKVLEFAGAPKDGAMGLFWENDDLYCMGDGGLRRYRHASGEGRTKPPELLARLKTGGEHEAHAIRRGPDGWLYVLCGNATGIKGANATLPTSPIKDPVAGCMLRFSPDFKGCEIVADGFRNAYGFDYNSDGEWFTYDSDNERCVSLPWYEGTRLYHILPGGHYGWQNPQHAVTWRQPPYFADVVAPLLDLGRGSPTGVVCYRHVQFPQEYRDRLFLLDWTFGKVWSVKLTRSGSTYKATAKVFLEAVGENGFAPTAAAVHPLTGDLFISIGGRGTRGAVYRIRHTAGFKTMKPEDAAKLQPKPRSLEWNDELADKLLKLANGDDLRERRISLELMARHVKRLDLEKVRDTIFWNGRNGDDLGIVRSTIELIRAHDEQSKQSVREHYDAVGLNFPFIFLQPDEREAFRFARLIFSNKDESWKKYRMQALRWFQVSLGEIVSPKAKGTVWEGYSRRKANGAIPDPVSAALRAIFPSGDHDYDREISRTLAMIEDDDPATLAKIADQLSADSNPIDDVHYLIVIARLRAKRTAAITKRVADSLLSLDRKLTQRKMNRDTNWQLRVGEMFAELIRKDDALVGAMLANPQFGRPDHAFFARTKGFDRRRAAEIFIERARKDADFAWNAAVVELIGELPPERSLPVLRSLWGQHGLDETILPILAAHPEEVDRARFVHGLTSARPATVSLSLAALEKLPQHTDREQTLDLILALRRLPQGKEEDKIAGRLAVYLEKTTGEKHGTNREAWSAWFARKHPELAKRLAGSDGVDATAWNKRLSTVDWTAGNVERGRTTFTKASCASCHSGAQALGPDLRGVAGRFSRADLFTAIIQPSKDVSPRYRTTQIVTGQGKVYQGIIVYEAVDSLILQTGPAATLRLVNKQITERRLTTYSLMPAELIDKLTDREIADLYAFLKALK